MKGKKYPGLQDKLAWFYNDYIARTPAPDLGAAKQLGVYRTLRQRSPGFAELYQFRNDISHGVINKNGRSLANAQRLRQQAKNLGNDLFSEVQRGATASAERLRISRLSSRDRLDAAEHAAAADERR